MYRRKGISDKDLVNYQPSLFSEQAAREAIQQIYRTIDQVISKKPVKRYEKTLSIKDILRAVNN